jgi:PHD/YefM family antitoxin component YafN of YafNO toxin-antitoxin module
MPSSSDTNTVLFRKKYTANSLDQIQITGKCSNAVLVAEEDWRAIQESLYLVSIPGMRESICSGLATPVKAYSKKT